MMKNKYAASLGLVAASWALACSGGAGSSNVDGSPSGSGGSAGTWTGGTTGASTGGIASDATGGTPGANAGGTGGSGSGGTSGADTGGAAASGGNTGNDGSGGDGGTTSGPCGGGTEGGRYMECLDRGVIAVSADGGAFISWRLLGTDPADIGFNLYRQVEGQEPALVCSRGPDEGTWCKEGAAAAGAVYFVRSVIDDAEGAPSGSAALLPSDHIAIPLEPATDGAFVHLAWAGDLDADGEFDLVVNRISASQPVVDGYSRHGELLWRLDTGPLGVNQDNIEGGATTMSNGMWDGMTVQDFDGDGFADVAIKTASGFIFGDGTTLDHENGDDQFLSIVDGVTGAEVARTELPDDFQADGPLQCHFGAGYFDGVHPSIAVKCKNRVGSGGFNLVAAAYDFDGVALTERFKYLRNQDNAPDFHQIRLLDVDGDGKDEFLDGGYVLDDDGTLLYSLGDHGVIHGDRFHITDIDPARPGLEGFGIQQDNPNGLETYYYDAATGEILRRHEVTGPAGDLARGTVADVFPDSPGFEYWSFNGLFAGPSGTRLVAEVSENVPWPNFAMQWDGDLGSELLDQHRVGDWDTVQQSRNTYVWRRSFEGASQARGAIPFYGDIYGDWRDEAVLEHAGELRIYTTTYETEHRLYTMAHNPAYRNNLTVHGYKQSHHVDYFLGVGMDTPPTPHIRLVQRP